jgi:hypothetical protein
MDKRSQKDQFTFLRTGLLIAIQRGQYSRYLVSEFRKVAPVELFPEFVAFLHDNPYPVHNVKLTYGRRRQISHKDPLLGHAFPTNYAQLRTPQLLAKIPTLNEAVWALETLKFHAEPISKFVTLSHEFHAAHLSGDAEQAKSILDYIEDSLGQSLWLIKKRIPLLQITHGLDSQKQFSAAVRKATHSGSLTAFITHYTSERSEPSVTPARFQSKFDERLTSWQLSSYLRAYLCYHITPSQNLTIEDLAAVLRFENASSAIDYYEALIFCLQCAVSRGYNELIVDVLPTLNDVAKYVQDTRLLTLLGLCGVNSNFEVAQRDSIELMDAFITGDLQTALQKSAIMLQREPGDINSIIIRARSCAILSKVNIDLQESPIVRRLITLFRRCGNFSEATLTLTKEAIAFFGSPWANAVLAVLEEENSNNAVPVSGSMTHFAAVGMPYLHPLWSIALPAGEHQQRHTILLSSRIGTTPIIDFCNNLSNPEVHNSKGELSPEERIMLETRCSYVKGNFDIALAGAEQLSTSDKSYYMRRAIRFKCAALLKVDRVADCSDLEPIQIGR